ncbi:MAG: phosphoribosylformylglycinamidine synthase subunit PurL, partial [Candidatus Kapaibacterium sp.]
SKRPSVQVGDPFTEKLLLEATLEVIRSGAVVGIQDMGAAGITCSSSEMSAKGNCGMEINLDKVPLRDEDMSAYEIMLSESQERMLLVAHSGKGNVVKDIFDKWDLNCVEVGKVISDDRIKIYYKDKLEADIPANVLVLGGGAPVYKRDTKIPEYIKETSVFDQNEVPEPDDCNEVLLKLLSSPNITNKRWVYEQYDSQVRTNTSLMPGGDASVIRIKGTNKGLAMKTDCNGRYSYLSPYAGGMIAVCESARNVVCTGAVPLAITNCLNFGDPYNPEMYYQFVECVKGMGEACRFLGTPVTGGNVSFYNLSKDYAVFPTPTIGMVGLIEDISKMMTSYFKNENDDIYIIGKDFFEIGGSEYLSRIHKIVKGNAPQISLENEKSLHGFVLKTINAGLIKSAHDVSDGGLAVALAECCIMGNQKSVGCEVFVSADTRKDFTLFSESQSRIIISAAKKNKQKIFELAEKNSLIIELIGNTGGSAININNFIRLELDKIFDSYFNSIHKLME